MKHGHSSGQRSKRGVEKFHDFLKNQKEKEKRRSKIYESNAPQHLCKYRWSEMEKETEIRQNL
jgi:hypothetical protein